MAAKKTATKRAAKTVAKTAMKPAKRTARQAGKVRVQPEQPGATELSRDQISAVMKILKDVGSVEIKLVAPIHTHRATIAKIGIDPIETEVRQVYFFDTPNLDLNKAGVVVRARRIQGGAGDTVVKLRPVDPAEIGTELRRSESFKTEIDVVPGGFVCSGSFKGRCTAQEAKDAVGGKMPLDSLFSKEQRAFYRKHAPKGIALRSLETYGPTFVLKARKWLKQLDRRLVVEMWLFPDGSRNLEISMKCAPSEAFHVAQEAKEYFKSIGIELSANQQTKTRAAMQFFQPEVRQQAAQRKPRRTA
jgi:hypothetical protein